MNRIVLLSIATLMATGCVTDYEVKPDRIEAGEVTQYEIVGPIVVQGMTQDRYIKLYAVEELSGGRLDINYREIAESAASMLTDELEKRRIAEDSAAPKSLRIHVSDVRLMGTSECYINFVVETADGYQRGYQAIGKDWNYKNVCNEAFPDIAARALGDPNIQAYLQK